jgi:polyhydroxyalkanoate synthesis regulator phasin
MTINEAIQEMQALTQSDNAWLREKATKVIRYNHQHDSGQLSTAEYTDLLNDLARIEEIQEEADAMKYKAAIEKIITTTFSLLS